MRNLCVVAFVLVVGLATAGCTFYVDPCAPRVTERFEPVSVPTDAGSTAIQPHVAEPYELVVILRSLADPPAPVADAPVAFFVASEQTAIVKCGDDEETTRTQIVHRPVADARSDDQGIVRSELAPGQTVHVAVGASSQHHGAEILGLSTGAAGSAGQFSLDLVLRNLTLTFDGSVGLEHSHTGTSRFWQSHAVQLHRDPGAETTYRAQLTAVTATVRWDLDALEYANFGAGVAPVGSAPMAVGYGSRPAPGASGNEARVSRMADQLNESREAILAHGLEVGVAASDPIVTTDEIEYALELQAMFASPELRYDVH